VTTSTEQSKGPCCFVGNMERLWASILGFRGFASIRQHQHTTFPEFVTRCRVLWFRGLVFSKIQSSTDYNSRKVISTSGIRSLGFCECKCPNNHTYKPLKCHCIQQSPNSESNKMWDPLLWDFGFWDFDFRGFTNTWCINTNEKENPKCEKRLGCGPYNFGFRGLLTPDAKHYTTSNAESRSYEKGKGPIQYRVSAFGNA
jgi:hypothetical protein